MEDASLAERIAEAFRRLGFFVGQRDIDEPNSVVKLLRDTGVMGAVEMAFIDRERRYYVIDLSVRGCRSRCSYDNKCRGEEGCLEECINNCMSELRAKVVEALERYARRVSGRGAG
ncbi:MAG: hypothetical protein DSY37_03730 [Hyperthermus sp.]|nr:MAG: hypothetical protein DSY37_03730 [Hyperthermus sp.]